MLNPRTQQKTVVVLVAFFTLILIFQLAGKYGTGAPIASYVPSYMPTAVGGAPHGKNAFVVFLNANPSTKSKRDRDHRAEIDEIRNEDHYFTGTRMLMYQLLHNPETRTNTSIDFVILVQKEVPQANRDQLRREGAIVKEVEDVTFDWIKPGRERWAHVMTKLRVFQLVEYEKVLLMDCDIVVTQRLDAIFDDPAAQITDNFGDPAKVMADEAPQPKRYLMAGNSGPARIEHPWPGVRGDRLNAGFVILHPSEEMYKHQYSVASIEGRFPGGSPEQDLWNYVYSRERNMPWKQVDPVWTVNTPIYNDYIHGVRSIHEKYWSIQRDPELRDVLLKIRWKMQGFFEGYHQNM
jgi:alpha-N-acetylglucosamine transferase